MSDTSDDPQHRAPAPLKDDQVIVGLIRGPSGLRGDVRVEVLTDSPERFSAGSVLHLEGEPATVLSSRHVRGGLVVKLDVVADRDRAESLRGRPLTVPSHQVNPLPAGSYYHFEIIDMGVWTEDGEYVGEVKEVLPTGANDVYVVKHDGKELLIPALQDVVLEVDTRHNKMTVRLPEGLT